MPKIRWTDLPANLRQHLFDRVAERQIPAEDLYKLKLWRSRSVVRVSSEDIPLERTAGEGEGSLTSCARTIEWVKCLSADVEGRRRWLRERRASGTRGRLDELLTSFGAPRQTSRSRERGSRRAAMAKN